LKRLAGTSEYAWLFRRQASPAPLASASSVVAALPLTPVVSQRADTGFSVPGCVGQSVAAVAARQRLPV
jgi:hypothetical protein